jgi:hypothetical protein
MDMFYKSCNVFHQESNKIGFHFSNFSTIWYKFYKNQQICFTIGDSSFQPVTWKVSKIHTYALSLRLGPWKGRNLCNVVLGHGVAAARRNSDDSGGSTTRNPLTHDEILITFSDFVTDHTHPWQTLKFRHRLAVLDMKPIWSPNTMTLCQFRHRFHHRSHCIHDNNQISS